MNPNGGHTLLLVDDEPALLAALRRTLGAAGYGCVVAGSGREALAVLESQPVQVIITDIDMPEMDGLELLRRAREVAPSAVRVVLTGRLGTELAIRAINEGEVHRYLHKPFDSGGLRRLVAEAVERHAELARTEEVARRERERCGRLEEVELTHPGICSVARSEDGGYMLDGAAAIELAERVGLDFLLHDDR